MELLHKSDIQVPWECGYQSPVYGYLAANCYNTARGKNIKAYIPAGYPYPDRNNKYNTDFSLDQNAPVVKIVFRDKMLNKDFTIYTRSIEFNSKYAEPSFAFKFTDVTITNILSGDIPQMKGPLNQIYNCSQFTIDDETSTLSSCETTDATALFSTFRLTGNGQWDLSGFFGRPSLKSAKKLPVLGSHKGLELDLFYNRIYCCGGHWQAIADNNLNLIQGTVTNNPEGQSSIQINGYNYYIGGFKVESVNNNYVLKITPYPKTLKYPRIQNIRLIKSGSKSDEKRKADLICQASGYEFVDSILTKNEFISGVEQFYDISTEKIVDKTDEDVDVVSDTVCVSQKEIETTDY